MIRANELKVGNRLNRELGSTRGMDYDPDFVLTEEWMCKLFGDNISIALQDLHPILLTPEILKKAGFRGGKVKGITSFSDELERSDYDKNNFTYYWDLSIKQSDHVDNFTFSLVKWGKKQEYFTFSFQNLRVRIVFVHQLQNLYFALTGTELEITL